MIMYTNIELIEFRLMFGFSWKEADFSSPERWESCRNEQIM